MITEDDLKWWLETAAQQEWIWAKTYADTAPHSYIVEGRTPSLDHDDYVRAGRVIHTFGRPAKFYGMTSIYLTSPDGRLKWWTMDADVRDTGLINQATTERLYGVQNAPTTESGIETQYDAPSPRHTTSATRRQTRWRPPFAMRLRPWRGSTRRLCSTSGAAQAGCWISV